MKGNGSCLFSVSSTDFKANLLLRRELRKGERNITESSSLKAAVRLLNRCVVSSQPCLKKSKPVGSRLVAGRLCENRGRQYGRGENRLEKTLSADHPINLGFEMEVVK